MKILKLSTLKKKIKSAFSEQLWEEHSHQAVLLPCDTSHLAKRADLKGGCYVYCATTYNSASCSQNRFWNQTRQASSSGAFLVCRKDAARVFLLNWISLSVSCCSRSTQSRLMGSLLCLMPAAVAAWPVSTCCSNLEPSRSSGTTLLHPFMKRSREVTFKLWVKLAITRWGIHLLLANLRIFFKKTLVRTGVDK